jgi:hypothetical protein
VKEAAVEIDPQLVLAEYFAYLFISVAMTIWVARTLYKHGRVFLVDAFAGNEKLADGVNHLLVVGFYLINIGYVSLALSSGVRPVSWPAVVEVLSSKVGVVLLVLGGMHFFNLFVFSRMRKRGLFRTEPPPVLPTEYLAPEPIPQQARVVAP